MRRRWHRLRTSQSVERRAAEAAQHGQPEHDPAVAELLAPVERRERGRVGHPGGDQVRPSIGVEVALVDAVGAGRAGERAAQPRVAIAVVGVEEEQP